MSDVARRRRSIRTRATAWVALIALVVGALGAAAFVVVLRHSLHDGVRSAAEQTLSTISSRVETEGAGVVTGQDDDLLVQLQTDSGSVVAHGDDAGGSTLSTDDGAIVVRDDERWLLVSDDVDAAGIDDAILVVGASLDDADDAVSTVIQLLVIVVPIVVVAMAILTWIVVGRALRPVERIRLDAEAIRGAGLHDRVVEPGTGDEVDRLARTLNGMLGRLDAAQSAQQRFVSDASHELRSPLATVRQHAELARLYPDETSLSELADVVLSEGTRQQELVDSLLLLSRLDEIAPSTRSAVDLDDVVLAEASRVRALGRVAVDSSQVAAVRVTGDERLLTMAVRNLVDNAARHAGSRVRVSTALAGDTVMLIVDDDGAGIPEADRERVFDRFVRLDEGRDRDSGGSGLGLAIVESVVRSHGGTVAVETADGGGARFVVRVPAA
ncbi:signal transduction histidine kinase [Frondihabitans sp. PhB188]|uniref:sensor histidine kinase n=1 Tax=Frondihabitans sp. PhB188 TaxID=2485200 RepID=UPI000F48ED83|nr:HAMP domain-containing sensor histidine kinase [Frondihabitans sp. PhB188]ROQ40720.1 signal transduction histidine kinase [Frondihabitans sp. PhB188]